MTIIVPFVPLRLLLPPLAPFSTFPSTSPSSLLPSLLLPLLSFLLRLYVFPISSYLFILSSHLCPAYFASLLLPFLLPPLSFPFLLAPALMPCPASSIFSRTSLFCSSYFVLCLSTFLHLHPVPMALALLFSSLNPFSASISFLSYRHSHVSLVLLLLAIYS